MLVEQTCSGIINIECETGTIGEEHGSSNYNNRSSNRQLRRKRTQPNQETITENEQDVRRMDSEMSDDGN